ncbi:quinone oxidoreductase family protein [Serratia rubidaea]|uniref:quinone oxidoreductase family protein n=1 Tax=Serratia rubidaea TaxID=61652 RepID=UPI00242AC637|nr:quinone oxidoreductase [Serratia rubidaea]MCR1000661.1 quinone oxidoreductase [Serratia rubidaea]
MKAIRVHKTGGPEVLGIEEVSLRTPGSGELLIRNRAIGVNYTDVYTRTGAIPSSHIPLTPGKEAAGEVVDVGPGVSDFKPGDRVAYVETPGAYAEMSIVPEHFVVHLPDTVSFVTAAASMLKGLTAHFLSHKTFPIQQGNIVLIHAAAGGVGSILTQWAKKKGATVIGTVGSPEKMKVAWVNGCDHVINYNVEDFVERVREITNWQGCDVVYDSVGQSTFPGSLDCLRPFGYFVSFGFASGPIPAFDIRLLVEKGSLFATWPGLTMYLRERQDVISMSDELFSAIGDGSLNIPAPDEFALSDAAEAHRRLESRKTTKAMVLIP